MIEESERRCRWCSKRMWKEVDPYYFGPGTRWIHECWACDHTEVEIRRPSLVLVRGGRSAADRLRAVRMGEHHAS